VRGGERVAEEISRILGVKPGSTSEDGEYSLESVNCLGACALAPLVMVNGECYGKMTPEKAREFFENYQKDQKGCRCAAKTTGH
jgi:NADH-quinone oxidoreductase subunit E